MIAAAPGLRRRARGAILLSVIARLAASLGLLATLATGCWFDSRVLQERQVQKNNAEALRPKALAPTGATTNARTYRVRVHATPQYVAQTIDWKRELASVIDGANAILGPTAGAKLKVSDASAWKPQAPTDDLGSALEALALEDPGEDADWVLGLIGGLPKASTSFHDLGIALVPGAHIVLRATTDLGETDAIEKGLGVSAAERAQLLEELRRHRTVAVLLHEIGHTLAALHENDKTTIMSPVYGKDVAGFSPGAAAVMKVSLANFGWAREPSIRKKWAKELLEIYEGPSAPTWVNEERVQLVATLRSIDAPAPAPAPAKPPAPPPLPSAVASQMPAADRALYEQATKLDALGDAASAWKTASPLFEKYPDLLPVQDFRCQLATKIGGDMAFVRKECERLMKLSTGK